jgi:hypothetical protein
MWWRITASFSGTAKNLQLPNQLRSTRRTAVLSSDFENCGPLHGFVSRRLGSSIPWYMKALNGMAKSSIRIA